MTYKGSTPTQTFTFPEEVDFSTVRNIYVTYSNMDETKIFRKTGDQLTVDTHSISIDLSQEDTLKLSKDYIVQVNWTFGNGKRAVSNKIHMKAESNLENEVLP